MVMAGVLALPLLGEPPPHPKLQVVSERFPCSRWDCTSKEE